MQPYIRNDPQLLGEEILRLKKARGCSILEAADAIFEDQARNGWSYRSPDTPGLTSSPGTDASVPMCGLPPDAPSQSGTERV